MGSPLTEPVPAQRRANHLVLATATFTPEVPERLVAQFFTHLATTTPVERVFRDVPYFVQKLDDALITPVHRAAVNPHVHHAGAQIGRAVHRR